MREKGGRARGRALQARHERAAPAVARACLPAHVGVIFKRNVVLAAQPSGGRVGPPAPAGGRGGAHVTASTSEAQGPTRLSPLRASCTAGRSGREPDCEFRALSKPLPRQVFSPRNAAFCKLGLGSLIHIPGTKPPLSFRLGGRARPGSAATRSGVDFTRSHTHWHKIPSTRWIPITLRGLCPCSLAPNVPGPSVPVSWAHISAHVQLRFYFGLSAEGEVWGRGL